MHKFYVVLFILNILSIFIAIPVFAYELDRHSSPDFFENINEGAFIFVVVVVVLVIGYGVAKMIWGED